MTNSDNAPIYNLKAVVQETGLKPDTLRAWERRYGLPTPERTQSGHRLYSQRDIEIVKWLMARQDEGLTIRRAIDLWHQVESETGDPLAAEKKPSALPPMPHPSFDAPPSNQRAAEDSNVAELRHQWISACLRFDERTAEQVLNQAFAVFSAETVCLQILQRGLAEIGEGWHEGRITVQQEHFASALALRKIEAMLSSTPAPYRSGRILIGCPPEEEHTFIPLLLALLLRRRGYDIVYLGANIPVRSIEITVQTTTPKLVIFTAQQLYTAATLLDMAQLLQQERIPMAYGGRIFHLMPELTRVIPGYYLGDSVEKSLYAVEQIMLNPHVQQSGRQPPEEYRVAREHFLQHQADIEALVWNEIGDVDIPHRRLATANTIFGRMIQAALDLGNLDYLGPDLDWIENLLVNHHQIPADHLADYLRTYRDAAQASLDDRGALIVEWLAGVEQAPVVGIQQEAQVSDH